MMRLLGSMGSRLFSSGFLTIVAIVSCYVFGIFGNSALLAYDVDLQMDQARMEKTVEHYGEPVRDIVEQATKNNENNPERKPTAKNTYERESRLNDVLPEKIGKDFSKEDLENMDR